MVVGTDWAKLWGREWHECPPDGEGARRFWHVQWSDGPAYDRPPPCAECGGLASPGPVPLSLSRGQLARTLVVVVALTAHLLLSAPLFLRSAPLVGRQTPFADV